MIQIIKPIKPLITTLKCYMSHTVYSRSDSMHEAGGPWGARNDRGTATQFANRQCRPWRKLNSDTLTLKCMQTLSLSRFHARSLGFATQLSCILSKHIRLAWNPNSCSCYFQWAGPCVETITMFSAPAAGLIPSPHMLRNGLNSSRHKPNQDGTSRSCKKKKKKRHLAQIDTAQCILGFTGGIMAVWEGQKAFHAEVTSPTPNFTVGLDVANDIPSVHTSICKDCWFILTVRMVVSLSELHEALGSRRGGHLPTLWDIWRINT